MKHQVHHGNEDHCFATLRQCLVVFRQSAVLAQPSKCSLDDPSLRQDHKFVQGGPLDNFNEASGHTSCPMDKPARVAAIGKDQRQASKTRAPSLQQQRATVPILNVGKMDQHRHDQAHGIDDQMTLAAKDFLARIVPTIPPFSAVFTDWLSMMPTLGVGLCPASLRT